MTVFLFILAAAAFVAILAIVVAIPLLSRHAIHGARGISGRDGQVTTLLILVLAEWGAIDILVRLARAIMGILGRPS